MGDGPESRCEGRVYSLDGAVRLVLSCWGLVRVNDHLEQRVRIVWALFGNGFLFLVERLYVELFIGVLHNCMHQPEATFRF